MLIVAIYYCHDLPKRPFFRYIYTFLYLFFRHSSGTKHTNRSSLAHHLLTHSPMAVGERIFWLCFVDLKDIRRLMDLGLWRRTREVWILGWSMVKRTGIRPRPNGKRRRKKGGRVIDFLAININMIGIAAVSFSSFFGSVFYPHIFLLYHWSFPSLLTRTLHHIYYAYIYLTLLFFLRS